MFRSNWLVIVLVACSLGSSALAEELRYDNGEVRGSLAGLEPGEAEAMRLTTAHPARLRSVTLFFSKAGQVEIHIWSDNGGQQADYEGVFGGDLIEPVAIEAPDDGRVELALVAPMEICPECHFHVGHVVLAVDGPALLVDTSEAADCRAMLWALWEDMGYDIWFVVGEYIDDQLVCSNYFVRAEVEYHDVVEQRSFTDLTEESGFGRPGRIAAVDYDQDGDVDVLQGGSLLRNDGGTFVDVSQEVGLSEISGAGGGVFADYDRDGDLDLFLFVNSCCNEEEAQGVHDFLLRNDDGVFVDVTEQAGLFDYRPNQSAAWGDFDGDGFLDLFLPGYGKPGAASTPTGVTLFRNNGDGTFSDATQPSMIGTVPARVARTVTWADYDQDGLLDLYVGAYRLQRNHLFRNLGGSFEELGDETATAGIETDRYFGHTIGAEWGDLDNDTDLDLVVMNLAHPRFYHFSDFSKIYLNPLDTGGREFVDVREQVGVPVVETASEPALGDFDNDGDLDLFQTNVYVGRESNFYASRMVEQGELWFEEVSYPTGVRVDNGWGAVWADFDGDGDLDLLTRGLFRNDGHTGNWLKVRLVGGEGQDTFGTGATVTVRAGDLGVTRLVSAGKGVGNQNPFEQHFGLGAAESFDSIEVRWPGGQVDAHPCGPVNQRLVLVQGVPLDPPAEGCGEEEPSDGGEEEPSNGSGCGCHPHGRPGPESLAALALAALWAARVRRRTNLR